MSLDTTFLYYVTMKIITDFPSCQGGGTACLWQTKKSPLRTIFFVYRRN